MSRREIVQAGEVRSARVESLRAVAAIGVLIGHVALNHYGWSRPGEQGAFERLMLGGLSGVILFFALSGYLLYSPFARRDFGARARVHLGTYARNRALRILPLYVAVVAALFLLRLEGDPPSSLWRFLVFSPGFTREFFGSVFAPMWSLVVEIHFYVLLPLIAWMVGRASRGRAGRAAAILGALGAGSLVFNILSAPSPSGGGFPLPWRMSLLSMFCFFVPGMLLAILRTQWNESWSGRLRAPFDRAGVWLVAGVGLWGIVVASPDLKPLLIPSSFLLVAACVLPLRGGPVLASLDWKPLALIGVVSYSVYLLHLTVIHELVGLGWPNSSAIALLALSLGATVALAAATYAGVERTFLRLRERWTPSPTGGVEPAVLRLGRRWAPTPTGAPRAGKDGPPIDREPLTSSRKR